MSLTVHFFVKYQWFVEFEFDAKEMWKSERLSTINIRRDDLNFIHYIRDTFNLRNTHDSLHFLLKFQKELLSFLVDKYPEQAFEPSKELLKLLKERERKEA